MQARLYLQIAGVIAAMVLVGALGYWLGSIPPRNPHDQSETQDPGLTRGSGAASGADAPPEPVPLYLMVGAPSGNDLAPVIEEVKQAASADFHQFVVSVSLPWDPAAPIEPMLDPLRRIVEADPGASFILQWNLSPPAAWLEAHPEAAIVREGQPGEWPSAASGAWMQEAREQLRRAFEAVRQEGLASRVTGHVIGALEEGSWFRTGPHDQSEANTAAFREWLRARYPDEDTLREAWGDKTVAFDAAPIPAPPDPADPAAVFVDLPKEQALVDFRLYTSQSIGVAIETFTAYVKELTNKTTPVFVPYGYTFEPGISETGHADLSRLLRAPVDGFVGPVSRYDRGPGGAGGMAGPVDSAHYHGKRWILLDDTRTGISFDPATGAIGRQAGLRMGDVYSVHRRNFAAALIHGLGLMWADPAGEGRLADNDIWNRFSIMRHAYREVWKGSLGQAGAFGPSVPKPSEPVPLMVVVDEKSLLYSRNSALHGDILVRNGRDCALRAGVATQFCLLDDVLEGIAPPANAYLFLNAFSITEDLQTRLHAILAEQKSSALWLYAPGFFRGTANPENVAAITKLPVKKFDKPAYAGSMSALSKDNATWLREGEEIGQTQLWNPLFYLDVDEKDDARLVLARYRESDRPSVVLEFLEDGWASVFIAEPQLTVSLLREILRTLDVHLVFQKTEELSSLSDVACMGRGVIAIHAGASGERVLDLGDTFDIQDLLEIDQDMQFTAGWYGKQFLTLPLAANETRVLYTKPVPAIQNGALSAAPEVEPAPEAEPEVEPDQPNPEESPASEEPPSE